MSIERRKRTLLDINNVSTGDEYESWAVSYIDLLLLMVTLFVLLLSYQQQEIKQADVEKPSLNKTANQRNNRTFVDQVYMSDLKGRVSLEEEPETTKLAMSGRTLFFPADATLSRSGEQVLNELAVMLKQRPWHILVEGHTSNQKIVSSRYSSNWDLSSDRASMVMRYLIAKGISAERLSAIGYAGTRPVASNDNEQGRSKNERVTLVLRAPG